MNSQHRPEASAALPSRCRESCPIQMSNYGGAGRNKVEGVSDLTRQTDLEVERCQSRLHGYSGPLPVADKQGEEKRMLTLCPGSWKRVLGKTHGICHMYKTGEFDTCVPKIHHFGWP